MENTFDDANLFDQYLNGELNSTDKNSFESRLANEEDFAKAFNFHKETISAIENHFDLELKASLQHLEKKITESGKTQRWFNNPSILGIAAAVIVLIVSVFIFLRQSQNDQQIFTTYYKSYPNIISPSSRGNEIQVSLAFQYYDAGNYEMAIRELNKILARDSSDLGIRFYIAQSAIALDQLETAKDHLAFILSFPTEQTYLAPSIWYLALIEIKKGNKKEATLLLDRLIENHPDYKERANEVLAKL
jgi:tetratricopeptide (TPR) repeat protein